MPRGGATQSVLHQSLVVAIRDYIRARRGFCLKYFAGGLGAKKGMPDFLVALPIPGSSLAAFVGIEAKTGAAVLNDDQEKVRAELEAAHILYLVIHSPEELESALLNAGLIDSPALTARLFG